MAAACGVAAPSLGSSASIGLEPKARDAQVSILRKLLDSRGQGAAKEMRGRIAKGQGVSAKGHFFDTEVLAEALKRWEDAEALTPRRTLIEERKPPAMPASWRVDGEPSPGLARMKSESARQETPNPGSPSPTRLKRKPASNLGSHTPGTETPSVRIPKNTPSASASRRGELRNFMEASRKRTLGGDGAAGVAGRNGSASLSSEPEPGYLARTAAEIAARRRSTPAPAAPRRRVATPCRSEPDYGPSPPARSSLSTPSAFAAGTGLESPVQAAAARNPAALASAKRQAGEGSTDAAPSPPSKRQCSGLDSGMKPEPHPEPSPTETQERCPQQPAAAATGSVRELKALLSEHRVDFSGCVEKAELQALWLRFSLSQKHVSEPPLVSTPPVRTIAPQAPAQSSSGPCSQRDKEAQEEVLRILSLRREDFRSLAEWGFAVLGPAPRDAASVQRSYRTLMRKLHPDKVTQTATVEKTIQMMREAKDACERSLSRLEPPLAPRDLRFETLNSSPGKRRFQLRWAAPEGRQCAPVTRYLVAALDPAYGKPLTITVLEPDYNQELRRFVSVEELNSFVLAEEELQKMPSLWKQSWATVQIAAANEAGHSAWAKLEVPLKGASSGRLSLSTTASPHSGSQSSYSWDSGSESSPRAGVSSWAHDGFERELRKRNGPDLRDWVGRQKKAPLAAWLKSLLMPTSGNKEELVDRIMSVMGEGRAR
mmetsp:Transcript_42232/g.76360  ORF Transcript_42232/g.76360 Transcript_42232/m.76360 type:complete len:713 (+) Transcript_42232:160-2298(+)